MTVPGQRHAHTDVPDPRLAHPPWCSLDNHHWGGGHSQLHQSRPTRIVLEHSAPNDVAAVIVHVEQGVDRLRTTDPWEPADPWVMLEVTAVDRGPVVVSRTDWERIKRVMDAQFEVLDPHSLAG